MAQDEPGKGGNFYDKSSSAIFVMPCKSYTNFLRCCRQKQVHITRGLGEIGSSRGRNRNGGAKIRIENTHFSYKSLDSSIANEIESISNNDITERIYSHTYLSTRINSNGNNTKQIKFRISRSIFSGLRKSFSNRDHPPLDLRTNGC